MPSPPSLRSSQSRLRPPVCHTRRLHHSQQITKTDSATEQTVDKTDLLEKRGDNAINAANKEPLQSRNRSQSQLRRPILPTKSTSRSHSSHNFPLKSPVVVSPSIRNSSKKEATTMKNTTESRTRSIQQKNSAPKAASVVHKGYPLQQRQRNNDERQRIALIGELVAKLMQLQSEELEVLDANQSVKEEENKYEQIETEFSRKVLALKSEESAAAENIRLQEVEEIELRDKLQKLKSQTSVLTREVVEIDGEIDSCRSRLIQLSDLIRVSKSQQIEADAALPILRDKTKMLVDDVLKLESSLISDVASVIRLEVKVQMMLKDVYWMCRLWSPDGPSHGYVKVSLPLPPSSAHTAYDDQSNHSVSPYSSMDGEIEISIPESPQQSSNDIHSTWLRLSHCSHDSGSNMKLPVHSILVPFDSLIKFDAASRPHSLLLTNWDNVKCPLLSDSFNLDRCPATSDLDMFEQYQICHRCKIFIDEALDPYDAANKPTFIGFVCLGQSTSVGNNEYCNNDGSDLTFWGSDHPRLVYETPIIGSFAHKPKQPKRVPGLLETAIDSLYAIINERNNNKSNNDDKWWIEASITLCEPNTISNESIHETPSIRRSVSTPSFILNETKNDFESVTSILKGLDDLQSLYGINQLPTIKLNNIQHEDSILTDRIADSTRSSDTEIKQNIEDINLGFKKFNTEDEFNSEIKKTINNIIVDGNKFIPLHCAIIIRVHHPGSNLSRDVKTFVFIDVRYINDANNKTKTIDPNITELFENIKRFPHLEIESKQLTKRGKENKREVTAHTPIGIVMERLINSQIDKSDRKNSLLRVRDSRKNIGCMTIVSHLVNPRIRYKDNSYEMMTTISEIINARK